MQFTTLANRVVGVSTEAILDCFISGLKAEICRDVVAHSPDSLSKVVALAKLFEEKYSPFQSQIKSQTTHVSSTSQLAITP